MIPVAIVMIPTAARKIAQPNTPGNQNDCDGNSRDAIHIKNMQISKTTSGGTFSSSEFILKSQPRLRSALLN